MQTQQMAIPAVCKRCGELFDLGYDLQGLDSQALLMEYINTAKGLRKSLCWNCRFKK